MRQDHMRHQVQKNMGPPAMTRVEIALTILGQRDAPALGRAAQPARPAPDDTGEGHGAPTGLVGASLGTPTLFNPEYPLAEIA